MPVWILSRTTNGHCADLDADLPRVQRKNHGRNAHGRLSVFLGLSGLWCGSAPLARGLLRLVFVWYHSLSAGSGGRRVLWMTPMQRVNQTLGRIPPWLIYGIAAFPPVWFFWLGLNGGLGVEPIKELEHRLGELALQVLIATLAIRPLREWTHVNLLKLRRSLGVVTFAYVSLHLLVWLVLDVQILSEIWADIVKRPYITVGMAGFILMIPLAMTSNNRSLRKLGPKTWKRLHQLTYVTAILGAVHFVMLSKGFQIEPLVYLGIVIALVATRIKLPVRRAVA